MQKRMVSLLLYVVMLAGLLPTTAMAANDTTAYILDVALQEGYYSTKGDITRDDGTVIEGTDIDMESRLDTAPEGRNNYLHYQDGVLTVSVQYMSMLSTTRDRYCPCSFPPALSR